MKEEDERGSDGNVACDAEDVHRSRKVDNSSKTSECIEIEGDNSVCCVLHKINLMSALQPLDRSTVHTECHTKFCEDERHLEAYSIASYYTRSVRELAINFRVKETYQDGNEIVVTMAH